MSVKAKKLWIVPAVLVLIFIVAGMFNIDYKHTIGYMLFAYGAIILTPPYPDLEVAVAPVYGSLFYPLTKCFTNSKKKRVVISLSVGALLTYITAFIALILSFSIFNFL